MKDVTAIVLVVVVEVEVIVTKVVETLVIVEVVGLLHYW